MSQEHISEEMELEELSRRRRMRTLKKWKEETESKDI